MNVGVIGGGLAGLSCAYKLEKKGADVKLFEKAAILGGRAPKAMRVVSENDESLMKMVEELGLDDEMVSLDMSKLASFDGEEMNTFDAFVPLLKRFEELSKREKGIRKKMCDEMGIDENALEKLHSDVSEVSFDPFERDERNHELHSFSMEEWLESFDESLQRHVLRPMMEVTFTDDLENMSADRGVYQVNKFIDVFGGRAYVMSNGPFGLTNAVRRKMSNCDFNISEKVLKVEKVDGGVRVETEYDTYVFDAVAVTVPLDTASDIVEGLGPIEYSRTSYTLVEGELKTDAYVTVCTDHEINLRAIFAADGEHFAYTRFDEGDAELDELYEEGYRVLGTDNMVAFPEISPGMVLPDQKFSDRIFLAGDYFYYPSVETAVKTGNHAAERIVGLSK